MKIAIAGAGPAGCRLAHLLADTEHEILLFDHRVRPSPEAGYEKPCGAGLSPIVGQWSWRPCQQSRTLSMWHVRPSTASVGNELSSEASWMAPKDAVLDQ